MFTVHLRIIVSGLQYNTYNQSHADGYKCPPQYRAIHDLSFSGHFLSEAICDTRIAGNSLWTNLVLEFRLLHCVLTRHDAIGLKQQANCRSLVDAKMLRDETQTQTIRMYLMFNIQLCAVGFWAVEISLWARSRPQG